MYGNTAGTEPAQQLILTPGRRGQPGTLTAAVVRNPEKAAAGTCDSEFLSADGGGAGASPLSQFPKRFVRVEQIGLMAAAVRAAAITVIFIP